MPFPSAGNTTGPDGATDEAVARFDGDTGQLTQDSVVTINDAGDIESPTQKYITSPALTANDEFPTFTTRWFQKFNGSLDLMYGFHEVNTFGLGINLYGIALNTDHLDATPKTDKDMGMVAIESSLIGGVADGGIVGLIGGAAGIVFMDDGAGITEVVIGTIPGSPDELNKATVNADQLILIGPGNLGIGMTSPVANTVAGQLQIGLANAVQVPTGTVTGGGILYSTAGTLHWLKSDGTDVNLTP